MERKTRIAALFILGLAALLLPRAAEAATYVLPAEQDAWVDEFLSGLNRGGDVDLEVVENNGGDHRSVLQFDLAAIPVGKIVASAVLQVYAFDEDGSGLPVNIYRVTDPWTEGSVTWNNIANSYDGSTIHGSFKPDSVGTWTVDITSLVQEWVDRVHPNHGLMLIATSFNKLSQYSSRESPSNRPQLTVITSDISVGYTDLVMTKHVDSSTPAEGDAVTYRLFVDNDGPNDATGIEVTDLLPAGVTYQSHLASQGTYASGSGLWTVGDVAVGDRAALRLVASVDLGTAGSTITNSASITSQDQPDPEGGNNSDAVDIDVKEDNEYRMTTGTRRQQRSLRGQDLDHGGRRREAAGDPRGHPLRPGPLPGPRWLHGR
jgi:uncharacterized repeat protein (TIGR01451 family)